MSISGQNLSIVIVTFKSEKVIHKCINSINKDIPIIVIENSNNTNFKKDLENKYKNVKCFLTNKNLGMGSGNNIGIKLAETEYVFIINPDTTLEPNTLEEIFLASEKIKDFSILSPISSNDNFPNYGIIDKTKLLQKSDIIMEVDYVDGFAMIFNKKNFKENYFFDENIFMYLENDDLCINVKKNGGLIFVARNAKINHDGAKAVDPKFFKEIELSRNWHWIWSKFYFNKKNFGIFKALRVCILTFISSILKFFFYSIIRNHFKKKIYFNRASGFYNALLGKASWYRPNIKD